MTSAGSDDLRLTALHHPRRNRYFSGKLLDASGLEMEQEYGRGADAQLARLVLGAGVVFGLEVTAAPTPEQLGIRVGAGLALDGWGRRIVVPCDVDIVPVVVIDAGGALLPADAPLPATMVVRLCYQARAADPTPAPLPHGPDGELEAGTWIEGYRVELREGREPPAAGDCNETTLDLIRAGRLGEALAALAHSADAAPVADPAVTLATITGSPDGRLTIDADAPRAVVPTNIVLLQLIACLAARVEECCAMSTPPPTPAQAP
jgi:hypothetical protein